MYIYKFCYLVPKGNFQSYFTYKYVNILTIKITVLTLTARQQYYSPQRRHRWHSIHFSDKIPCEVSHQGRSSAHKKSFTYNHNHFRQEIVAFNTIYSLWFFFYFFFPQWRLFHRKSKGSRYRCGPIVNIKLWCYSVFYLSLGFPCYG